MKVKRNYLGKVGCIVENRLVPFDLECGQRIFVTRVRGGLRAFSLHCPHMQADLVRQGKAVDCMLICGAHGYVYSLDSGENIKAPGTEARTGPLKSFDLVQEGDDLFICY